MYTNIKNVQIIISLLKQFDIHHLVISPGTRNTPLVHSVELDDFFECYSIVDERSAGFFALGLSEALDKPVCVTCTAATATCNYMPAIKEAYERNVQVVALTADRELYYRFHMEDQCINQIDMYKGYVKYSVDVPAVKNDEDYWYCNRCVNEALLELDHHTKGPIQINYHVPDLGEYNVEVLPKTRKITRHSMDIDWNLFSSKLDETSKILVVCGSYYSQDNKMSDLLKLFYNKYNTAILYDHFSNICDNNFMNVSMFGEILNYEEVNQLNPDIVITFGDIYYSTVKYCLDGRKNGFQHWHISKKGEVNDGFKNLVNIFECDPEEFFVNICQKSKGKNNKVYDEMWENRLRKVHFPDLAFTNFKVIQEFSKKIPVNAFVHMSVLDSIRLLNYMPLDPSITCFANIGADGIDGAMSTLFGHASELKDKLAFLLIGDLSFLYDLNAVLGKIPNNVRILVINNFAGAEFHKNFGLEKFPTLNTHIAAGHHTKIKDAVRMMNLEYITASNIKQLDDALDKFTSDNDGPMLLEVFTDANLDAETLKKFWKINRELTSKEKSKEKIKTILGPRIVAIVKKIKNVIK